MADEYYQSALRYGADAALVYYALGVNAAPPGVCAGNKNAAWRLLNAAQAARYSRERYVI
jgi:hypothetical protein